MKKVFGLITISIFLFFSSCATYKSTISSKTPTLNTENCQTIDNISVYVKLHNLKAKDFMGDVEDISALPCYIVWLNIENKSEEEIQFCRSDIKVITQKGKVLTPISADEVLKNFEFSSFVGDLGAIRDFPFGGSIIDIPFKSAARNKIKKEIKNKEIPQKIIIPSGEKLEGFLYFERNIFNPIKNSDIEIPIVKIQTNQTIKFNLKIKRGEK